MNRVSMLRRLGCRLRHGGTAWVWAALCDRLRPIRPACRSQVKAAFAGHRGLEIGGPSSIFRPRGALPVYDWADGIDNMNFSAETAWEHGLRDGGPYRFHRRKPAGRQWIREAEDLSGFADGGYEFVMSSHCLEHVANPLGALREWWRVTRAGGWLLVILPDPTRTFDHRRPVTALDHLRKVWARSTPEDDRTHFAEVIALHDLALDPDAGDPAAFRSRVDQNAAHRCVHHHVFDGALLGAALRETGWTPLAVERFAPLHLAALARKEIP
jgi:SAM-dependent methyltransferase